MEELLELYKTGWRKYIRFDGRACRAEFSVFTLPHILIFIWFAIYFFSSLVSSAFTRTQNGGIWSLLIVMFVFGIILIIPHISITVRRLHDLNQSGWILLAIILISRIPLIGGLVSLIWIIFIYLTPGTDGNNQFGPESEMF